MDPNKLDVEDKTKISGNIAEVLNDRFSVIRLIGQGGMGSVYKGVHLGLQKPVAIKIVSPNLVADQNVRARFDAEVRALGKLQHPNLINIIDVGVRADGCPFYVMEYIDGVPFDTVIKQEGALSLKRAVPIFKQIASALSYAHSMGIVHRDIKPSNIMLAENDFAKVIDLGIAKVILQDNTAVNKLTTTGEVFGSPMYMSPEQGSGKPIDARTDIYSLGCMMFEALTGRPPITGQTPIETIFHHMMEIPPPVSSLLPGAKKPGFSLADEIVAKCLEKEPDARYQSALELIKDLEYLELEAAGLKSGRPASPKQVSTLIVAPKLKPSLATTNRLAPNQQAKPNSQSLLHPQPQIEPEVVTVPLNPGLPSALVFRLPSVFRNKIFWLGMVVAVVPMLFFLTYLAGEQSRQRAGVNYGASVFRGSPNLGSTYSPGWTNETIPSPVDHVTSVSYDPVAGETPIYVATTFRGVLPAGGTRMDFGDVDVVVNVENKPLILALNSFDRVTWHIKTANERVKIEKVVACGFHPMKLIGLPGGAPVVKVWSKGFDADGERTRAIAPENQVNRLSNLMIFREKCLNTLRDGESPNLKKLAKGLEDWSGGSLAESEACYNGRLFKFPISDLNSH